jgi:hypothetical protein
VNQPLYPRHRLIVWTLAIAELGSRLQTRLSTSAAVALLALAAGLSGLIYWWGFVRPFALLGLVDRPLLNLYHLAAEAPLARWQSLSAFAGLGLLYWLGWRVAWRASGPQGWAVVIGGGALFSTLLWWIYPIGAADLFDNIAHGRVLGVYGANPFTTPPAAFADDPFLPYVAWRRSASAYGPGWEVPAAWVARLAGDDIIANVLLFKLLAGAFWAASVLLVALILRRHAPERALAGVLLLAWNPIVLYETWGNGHNDMALVFWILLATWALTSRRYTLAILALVLGALVKFIPLLLLPAAGLIALRDLPQLGARLRFILVSGLATVTLVVLAYAPFWTGLATLTVERRMQLYTSSLPAVLWALLSPVAGVPLAGQWIALLAAGVTALWALWQGVVAWRSRDWLSFPRAAFAVLFFYLLLTCLWFQPWYTLWPLGVAALLPPGHAARLAVLFGYTALAKPLLFEPLWLWQRPLPPKAWRELRLGPAVMALPWLYLLVLGWWRWGWTKRPADG